MEILLYGYELDLLGGLSKHCGLENWASLHGMCCP